MLLYDECRGSVLPYLVAWLLYQGTLLMTVLNFTGLFVNGLVCFVLPLLLVLKAMECSSHQQQYIEANDVCGDIELVDQVTSYQNPEADDTTIITINNNTGEDRNYSVHPLPLLLEPYSKFIVIVMIIIFGSIISLTLIIDAVIRLNDSK